MLKKEKLEELLVANWTKFIDIQKFMAFVLREVRNAIRCGMMSDLVMQEDYSKRTLNVSISRFAIKSNGFDIWADFTVPHQYNIAIGTCEIHLSYDGTFTTIRTLGNLLNNVKLSD